MRTEKEIIEKLQQIEDDLKKLDEMYDNDEIEEKPYIESHKTLSCIKGDLLWVLNK